MNKRPDFAADLDELQRDVSHDVNTILSVVHERNAKRGQPRAAPVAKLRNGEDELPANKSSSVRATPVRKPAKPLAPTRGIDLINVTTRLARGTKELLAEAALRQQLAKTTPDSEQAIIEEALQQWFKRAGYASRTTAIQEPSEADSQAAEEGTR